MVINKLKGAIGKSKPDSKDEAPAELEPLGEETKPDKKEEAPDELPELTAESSTEQKEAPKVEQQEQESAAPEPKPEPKQDTPDELDDIQPKVQDEEEQEVQKKHQEIVEAALPRKDDGFFSKINDLMKDATIKDKLLSQDLLTSMKASWGASAESTKSGLTSAEEKRLEHAIAESLTNLKRLEAKWRAQKMVIEEDMKILKSYESSIKENEKTFKTSIKQFRVYQRVPRDKIIIFDNGLMAGNISELLNALKILEDETFRGKLKQDPEVFLNFAKEIDKSLYLTLRGIHSRRALISILSDFVKKSYK